MTAVINPIIHNTIAESIFRDLITKSSKYYYFLGKTLPYNSGVEIVTLPTSDYKYELSTRRDIIQMKQITSSDVSYVVPRINWVSGTIYDQYDHTIDMSTKQFYVLTDEYNVYKCLDNNYDFNTGMGSPSTTRPSGTDVDPYTTPDGYKWKFMMNLPLSLRSKFLTLSYMPVTTALRSSFYNNGGIDTVIIENPGNGYNTYESTTITVNTTTGHQAELIPVIKDGVIVSVLVSQQGFDYSISDTLTVIAAPTNPGTGADLRPLIKDGKIIDVFIYDGGSNYSPNFDTTITIQTSTGSGAVLTPIIVGGEITDVTVDQGGVGYIQHETEISIFSNTGHDAVLTPIITNGVITDVTVVTSGYDYQSDTTLQIVNPYGGSGASLLPVIENGILTNVIIENPGEGYTYANVTVFGNNIGDTDAIVNVLVSSGNIDTIQANVEMQSVNGTIDAIKITNRGNGYGNAIVTIDGDGSGATAIIESACIVNTGIHKITVTDPGVGYTYATVTINGNGTGATAEAIISPRGGHGKDAVSELYANTLMFYGNISNESNNGFAVNNDFRQFGIIKNPTEYGNTSQFNSRNGSTCFAVYGSIDVANFPNDTLLIDGNGKRYQIIASQSTKALLHAYDNVAPTSGMTLRNTINNEVFTITAVTPPTVDKYNGELLYIDNRQAFYQTEDQTISFQTAIKF